MNGIPKLRVARPTDNLDALIRFYRDGLGLQILYRFENHDGIDGVTFEDPDGYRIVLQNSAWDL